MKKITLTFIAALVVSALFADTPITLKVINQHNFNPDAFGFNTQTAAGPSWDDPQFMERLKELKPANLRYPGGTIGNYLDWRTGQYMAKDLRDPAGKPPRQGIMGAKGAKVINRYRLEEFCNGIKASGASPVYMLNMLTDTLPGSIEMLTHAQKLGLPVKYIELGNEFYLSFSQGGKAPDQFGDYIKDFHYPTAEGYAAEATRYVSELKKIYPNARFAYNAVIDKPKEQWFNASARTVNWNEVMKKSEIGADAVILHLYTSNASTAEGLVVKALEEIADFGSFTNEVFPDTKIWVTEYNVKCDIVEGKKQVYRNAYAGQWIHGINSVVMTAELLMLPQVELLCFHNIAAGIPSAVVFADEVNIPISQGSSESLQAKPSTFSASGYAFSLLGYAMEDTNHIGKLITTQDNKTSGLDAIMGWVFTGKEKKALLINFTSQEKSIDGEIDGHKAKTVKQYSAEKLTSVINDAAKLKMTEQNTKNGLITLQPYSMAVVIY